MKKALFDGARSAPAAVAGPEAQLVAKVSPDGRYLLGADAAAVISQAERSVEAR